MGDMFGWYDVTQYCTDNDTCDSTFEYVLSGI